MKQPKQQSSDSAGLAGFDTAVKGTDVRKPDPLRDTGGGDRMHEASVGYLHRSR